MEKGSLVCERENKVFFGTVEFLLAMICNTKHGFDEGGGQYLSPLTATALSYDELVPVRGLSHRGSHSSGGETPVSVPLVMEHFFKACVSVI